MSRQAGTVVARRGGTYLVRVGDRELAAVLPGKLKQRGGGNDRVVVGDRVRLETRGDRPTIAGVEDRSTLLVRRMPGGKRAGRPVVANVDQVVVVAAARDPDPSPRMLDRFLVIAEANGLPAVLVVNKSDLALDAVEPLERRLAAAGYQVLRTSVPAQTGLAAFRDLLRGRESVLAGPSGVGKSSLLNAIQPDLALRTAPISRKWGTGTHTTTSAEMFALEMPGGGYVVDTPGLREVGLWGIDADVLGGCFPEFRPHLDGCRFTNCRHLAEPGCAVRGAAERGVISADRLDSYRRMLEEVSVPSWSTGRRPGS